MSITLAYLTNRRDPKIEWFLEAIHRQSHDHNVPIPKLIVVDFWKEERDTSQGIWRRVAEEAKHVAPMPNSWNGPWRKTKENWFAAASARNTALIWCETDTIAYVDDLSLPMPDWLVNVNQSASFDGVTLGSYMKVKNLVVENGAAKSYDAYPGGRDNRWPHGANSGSVPAQGNMLYGCSLIGPVEAFLSVGGWPSLLCDGLGFEDVIMGTVMQNAGIEFNYNRNMLTLEADELHGAEPAFRKESFEKHPHDQSDKGHAVLRMAKGAKFFHNYPHCNIRGLRKHMLDGGQWPEELLVTTDWHTTKELSEL